MYCCSAQKLAVCRFAPMRCLLCPAIGERELRPRHSSMSLCSDARARQVQRPPAGLAESLTARSLAPLMVQAPASSRSKAQAVCHRPPLSCYHISPLSAVILRYIVGEASLARQETLCSLSIRCRRSESSISCPNCSCSPAHPSALLPLVTYTLSVLGSSRRARKASSSP